MKFQVDMVKLNIPKKNIDIVKSNIPMKNITDIKIKQHTKRSNVRDMELSYNKNGKQHD